MSLVNDLHLLSELEILRKLNQGDLTLHVFGDASGLAYATAVFSRVEQDNIVSVQLLNAKSRLANAICFTSKLLDRLDHCLSVDQSRYAIGNFRVE